MISGWNRESIALFLFDIIPRIIESEEAWHMSPLMRPLENLSTNSYGQSRVTRCSVQGQCSRCEPSICIRGS
jgi:hypothetical protein